MKPAGKINRQRHYNNNSQPAQHIEGTENSTPSKTEQAKGVQPPRLKLKKKKHKITQPMSSVGIDVSTYSRPIFENKSRLKKIQQSDSSTDSSLEKTENSASSTDGMEELVPAIKSLRLNLSAKASPPKLPRTRKRHQDSEGNSESEDPNILFRSLRNDEDPKTKGLHPPANHDPSKTASQHITAGTRAKIKSPYISASRSLKVAAAYASKNKEGRVAKIKKPVNVESFDLTNPEEAPKVFPTMRGMGLNTAKASQEVVIKGMVPPENVLGVYKSIAVNKDTYKSASAATYPGFYAKGKSRTTTNSEPEPFVLVHDDN